MSLCAFPPVGKADHCNALVGEPSHVRGGKGVPALMTTVKALLFTSGDVTLQLLTSPETAC
jgi:hypothetical protein